MDLTMAGFEIDRDVDDSVQSMTSDSTKRCGAFVAGGVREQKLETHREPDLRATYTSLWSSPVIRVDKGGEKEYFLFIFSVIEWHDVS